MPDKPHSQLKYGPNVWLIDEMYRLYKEDPQSVGESWREFFADYKPMSVPLGVDQKPAPVPSPVMPPTQTPELPKGAVLLRGPAELIVKNMRESLQVPTATSTRVIPVKILDENRRIINNYLADIVGGKVSFTHIIAWAILQALKSSPAMQAIYYEQDGVPYKVIPEHINFGLAVDVQKKDGSRNLLVPNIKAADELDFAGFFAAYNDVIRKINSGQISPDDFVGTTITLTNPGTIGTVHSVPRLMQGQSAIIGTGAIDYPAEWQAADLRMLANLGISKVMMMTSTYDHRVIQGAESGLFLARVHALLNGEDGFYERIFSSLHVPYDPVILTRDRNPLSDGGGTDDSIEKEARVLQLINMYRVRGHLQAHLNPLKTEIEPHSELDPGRYGLSVWDNDREFLTGGLGDKPRLTLREILNILREAYCQTIGIEYMHIQEPDQKTWIQQHVEGKKRNSWVTTEEKHRLLDMLNAAEAFEKFLHTKYIGHKRFGLEGAESLIPMLDTLFSNAIDKRIEHVALGMAHRGRLNVLSNILGMSHQKIFREFEGDLDPNSMQGSGDVKYHLGASGEFRRQDGQILGVTLSSNPSHLEAVNPVVEGMARAMQDMKNDLERRSVMPVLIHGDAAFAGQGVVAETLNFSMLKGYRTGGTIHIVVNNGIGFTTSPADARSSVYATDVAKMVQAPIFHVNGDDPEACVQVMKLALAFRLTFQKDVVVDLICYRRHGHNEADDPSYTQPIMYARIKEKRSVRKLYTELLVNRGDITIEEAESALVDFHRKMEQAFEETKGANPPAPSEDHIFREVIESIGESPDTSVPKDTLDEVLRALTTFPKSFTPHPKLRRLLESRADILERNAIDWATAEALAFGSLLLDGIPVRLSGQDSRRGTFSQRHSVLVDYNVEEEFIPLSAIRSGQARFMAFDSLLSEYAILGFEYGYSVAWSDALVIWEAQFGDFINGGQIIVDQFIAAAEDKWNQQAGIVLLLPHGFEGQGPEHSSARLERFLILCAENNMRVVIPTTAAQYFHVLRRQALMEEKKPLIVLTPKSLLRADTVKSRASHLTSDSFRYILDDDDAAPNAELLLLCTGKVAFDLFAYRKANHIDNAAIVRIEQLYPFPLKDVQALMERYTGIRTVRWVQEEPRNMGAWNYMFHRLHKSFGDSITIEYVGRVASGSPATGSQTVHNLEQAKLIREAFE